jgi:MraZ protein
VDAANRERSEIGDGQMFTGDYRHSVDAKGRIAIPVRFRTPLGEGAVLARWVDGCAAIFPRASFEDLAEKVAKLPLSDERARAFSRFLFSGAFEVESDQQGRILLPAAIRDWSGVGSDAVVVGSRDHVEIWEPGRWEKSQQAVNSADALASHLTGLGI